MRKAIQILVALSAATALGGCGVIGGGKETRKTPVLGERVPILVSQNDLAVDTTIADVPVTLPPAERNAAWAQPGGNAAKSVGHLSLPASLSRAWSQSIPGSGKRERLAAAPVVADGKVYVMGVNGVVHAHDAASGALVWRTGTSKAEENRNALFGGGVSYEGGKLFATNGLGEVVALDAAQGTELWRAKPGGPLRGAPTLANGAVYVLTQDNQLFALDQADGRVQWTQSGSLESQGVFGVAAPAGAQGTIVAGFSSGELNAYRYENGRTVWADSLSRSSISTSVSSLADIDADPVIAGGQVYAIGQGGRIVGVEITSGRRLWEQNLAGISTPWVAGDWLFVVTTDAKLVAIARESGRIRWISQLPGYRNVKKRKGPISWTGPVLAGNRLILVSSEGEMTSVSPFDGSIQSTREVGGSYSLSPVVADDTLYLLDDDGKLTAWR